MTGHAAVEPATGHGVCLYLPALNHESHHNPGNRPRRPHRPYSPQLYPVERWFEGLRGALSNRVFETRAALETALSDVLQAFRNAPDRLARLTGFGWWLQALET